MKLISELTKTFLLIRKLNCEGCINNYGSQLDHDCCTGKFDFIYLDLAIDQLKKEGKLIGCDINQLIEEWHKK